MFRRLLAGLLMLVLSGTAAFAQPSASPRPAALAPIVYVHASEAHKCCHSSASPRLEVAPPLPPAHMPCGNEHSCCASPGPANVPEVPSTFGQQRPDAHPMAVLPGHSAKLDARPAVTVLRNGSLLPYVTLSTVLRI